MSTRAPSNSVRIGLLTVYYGLFDDSMPAAFRTERTERASSLAMMLSAYGEVIHPGLVDSEASSSAAAEMFAAANVDVIIFAPTMAAPPSYAWNAISPFPDVPLLAIVGQEGAIVPDDYNTEEATRLSAPVGLVMLTNVLVRRGRKFDVVYGVAEEEQFERRISDWIAGVGAALALRNSVFLAIGDPMVGYLDIEASDRDLASIGVTRVTIDGPTFAAATASVTDDHLNALRTKIEDWNAAAVSAEQLALSLRVACALESLVDQHHATGGAINCHSDVVRWNPGVGVTACLGVSCRTTGGIPFACTGDVPTAIALFLGQRIGGAALYCELYRLDSTDDWILIANGGEGDTSIRPDGAPVVMLPEDHYSGIHGAGVALAFPVQTGPSTLFSLTPTLHDPGGWRLVTALGEVIGSRHDAMEGPNAMFRPSGGDVTAMYEAWCMAGATHHAALVPGDRVAAARVAAATLGIHHVEVSSSL